MPGSLCRLSSGGTASSVPLEHPPDESMQAAGRRRPSLPSPTDRVRTARALLLPAAQATTLQPLGEAGEHHHPQNTLHQVTRTSGAGRESLLQPLETDAPQESGRITAAGLFPGARATYGFAPARGWEVSPASAFLLCLCPFPTRLLRAFVRREQRLASTTKPQF